MKKFKYGDKNKNSRHFDRNEVEREIAKTLNTQCICDISYPFDMTET